MKTYVYWLGLLLIAGSAAYLLAYPYDADSRTEGTAAAALVGKSEHKSMTRPSIRRPETPAPVSGLAETSPPPAKEARVYDPGNPMEREELVASLRAAGMKEDEVVRMLKPSSPEETAEQTASAEARTFDLSNPGDREQLVASLRAEGVGEDDIQRMVRLSDGEEPADADTIPAAEARAYDLNDPIQRDQLAASMRAEGLSDEDIQTRLRIPSDATAATGGNTP